MRRYAAILLGGGTAFAAIAYGLGTVLTAAVSQGLYPVDVLFWPDVLLSVEPHSNSGFEVAGGGLAMRVGLTAWFAWVALVSYRLLQLDSGRARPTSTPDRHQSVASAATPHG